MDQLAKLGALAAWGKGEKSKKERNPLRKSSDSYHAQARGAIESSQVTDLIKLKLNGKHLPHSRPAENSEVEPSLRLEQKPLMNVGSPLTQLKALSLDKCIQVIPHDGLQKDLTPPTISTLPYELLLQILACITDMQSLMAVTTASKHANIVYNQNRTKLITISLQGELEPQLINLLFACLDAPKLQEATDPMQSMRNFVRGRFPLTPKPTIPMSERTAEELHLAANLHYAVSSCAKYSCISFAKAHPDLAVEQRPAKVLHCLTRAEKQRMYRGWYLYELYCRLYSMAHLPRATNRFQRRPRGGFQPWEAEEMSCILSYVKSTYRFLQQRSYVNPGRGQKGWCVQPPRLNRDSKVDHVSKCNICSKHGSYTYQDCAPAGVALLSKCLDEFMSGKWQGLDGVWHTNLTHDPFDVFPGSGEHPMTVRDIVTEMGDENIRNPLPRKLDFSDDVADVFCKPNEGWTLAHKGIVSKLYNEPEFLNLREWGYVFWDHEKLSERGQARKEIEKVAYSRHRRDHWYMYVDWDDNGPILT